ncbi:MAG: 30S ribosomal protein S20 [Candidatus Colwellbacteria bacterium]|nr:30S ribosomal protein S20 [Candidatus Colwellbacteria bacterium]
MPRTKTAKKALRQNIRRRVRNLNRIKKLKAEIKAYKKTGDLAKVYSALDKAAKVNLIKKNKASRLKSRLSAQLKAKSTSASS